MAVRFKAQSFRGQDPLNPTPFWRVDHPTFPPSLVQCLLSPAADSTGSDSKGFLGSWVNSPILVFLEFLQKTGEFCQKTTGILLHRGDALSRQGAAF